ncbi:hypothetical protein J1614_001831 [Plenodomus biglobosus]|nr:hypothetical protein J1614_001831 [Plenodomus biglobosus]
MANTIAKQYTRLLTLWPKDALRPNLPFTRAIEHHGSPFGVKPLPSSTSTSNSNSTSTSKSTSNPPTPATPTTTTPPAPSHEQPQINALFSLLENRYSKKYPISQRVLKPASAPLHYTRLMEEIERAPRKSWWQAKVDEWKMKIRWS